MNYHKLRSAFTFIELIIVIAIIGVISVLLLTIINPLDRLYRSWDARRKMDLTSLSPQLEEWYSDKNCYPKPEEICYHNVSGGCYICGYVNGSPQLSSSSRLPCDPQHAGKDYLYQTDGSNCPSWYKIYAMMSYPKGEYKYNYGVSSPNTTVEPYPDNE